MMFKIIGDIHRQMDPKEHILVEILFKTFFFQKMYMKYNFIVLTEHIKILRVCI